MNPRVVAKTKVTGVFMVPIGMRFLGREPGTGAQFVEVSTVCLEGASLEDPLEICEPEPGFETMIFLEGCPFFSLFTKKYKTRKQAEMGHQSVVDGLLEGSVPLSVNLNYYPGIALMITCEIVALEA